MINLSQNDFNILKQRYSNRYIKLNVLDFQYHIVDEISGNLISCSVSVDADSDLRRSCSVSFVVNDNSFYAQPGSQIWLDKFIQLYVGILNIYTNEIQWYNQGIYLINSPSWNYDASTNTLSFGGLDLMSKLTGVRNGNLQGLPTVISQGENVREAIIDTLELGGFTKYVVNECTNEDGTIVAVPNDIEISAGGTVYDILSALRDILPQYQIYFDVNGIFHYDQIPSGEDDPVIIDDTLWPYLVLSDSINTDFESVKNYVEVYGRSHDVEHYSSSTTVSSNVISLTISSLSTLSDSIIIGFTTPETGAISGNLVLSVNSFGNKNLVDSNGNYITSLENDVYYVASYQQSSDDWLFLGHQQAQAIAQDENPDSPFYVDGPIGVIRIVLSGNDYDNIQSDELALQRAKLEIYWRCRLNDNITISCIPIPWLDVNIVISHALAQNATSSNNYIIKSFDVDYSESGTMSINAITFYPYYPLY